MRYTKYIFLLTLFLVSISNANNILVSNVTTTGQDVSAGTDNAANFTLVQFDISWENSFRDATNWDAAWVFIKYKTSDGVWHHATLSSSGHTAPSGSSISTVSNNTGVFIYRNANGTGTFSLSNVQLRWNYGADGVTDNETISINVLGIEMVYVPTGDFEIGDGNGTNESTSAFHDTDNNNVTITSSLVSNIKVDAGDDDSQIEGAGIGIDGDGGLDTDNDGNIDNADFPTGYLAFYCMKYELTQEQYRDFLNMLTRDQQNRRTATTLSSGTTSVTSQYVLSATSSPDRRNGIYVDATIHTSDPLTFYCNVDGDGIVNESNDGQNLPCNYIWAEDFLAYADWSGLRAMSELEFEKAARGGSQAAIYGEYAWGTNTIASSPYSLSSESTASEAISANYSTSSGNAIYSSTFDDGSSPIYMVRVGIFAANATNTGRVTSGSSYYGIMELSGNLAEACFTVGKSAGRSYNGSHGDGVLSSTGAPNVSGWTISGNALGYRGGYPSAIFHKLRISARGNALDSWTDRKWFRGGRFVRSAP